MSKCCSTEKPSEPMASRCPSSGSTGVAVDRQTVKALLTEMALRRLKAGTYRFCPDPDCDVVYFDGQGSCFRSADLRLGMILPAGRTIGGFRVYSADVVERLRFIKQAQLSGLTLA